MPCMGPSIDASYKQGEEIFEEFFKILQEKYHIHEPIHNLGSSRAEWLEAKENLKKAIQEMIWNDNAASF